MSTQTKSYTLPEPYSRQKLSGLYKSLSLSDDTVKLLRKYFKAMTNLYGIIPLDKAFEIIHSQNPGLLTRTEFSEYILVARHEREYFVIFGDADQYTGKKFETSLDRWLVDLCLIQTKTYYYPKVREMQADKPYYVPEKNILLRYHAPDYSEPTPQSKAMKRFWQEKIHHSTESAKNIFLDLQFIIRTVGSSVDDVVEFLKESDLQRLTMEEMTEFLELYMDMHNHTRMQCNRGHTPAEIAAMHPQEMNEVKSITLGANIRKQLAEGTMDYKEMVDGILTMELPNDDLRKDLLDQLAEIRKEMPAIAPASGKQAKVGRNDLCPCGSGKKYKKCCGKGGVADENQTGNRS